MIPECCYLFVHGRFERHQTPCTGQMVRAHLISQQTLRREVWEQRRRLEPLVRAMGLPFPSTLRELLWDSRVWVPACGGPHGNGGHHGDFDVSRTVKLPPEALPEPLLEFARQYGLLWWIEREYGREHEPTPHDTRRTR